MEKHIIQKVDNTLLIIKWIVILLTFAMIIFG